MTQKFCLFLICFAILSFIILPIKAESTDASVYFPQNLGDEHVYRKSGKLAKSNDGWTDKITDKKGKNFTHSNFWGDGISRNLKLNKKFNVVEKAKDKKFVWYKFADTSEWTIKLSQEGLPCLEGAKIKVVSHAETVQVPAGSFQNCLKLAFATNCEDAGIVEQWFAPNVGLVKQTESTIGGLLVSELVKASVGGKTYPQ